jgi:hypothetical protein
MFLQLLPVLLCLGVWVHKALYTPQTTLIGGPDSWHSCHEPLYHLWKYCLRALTFLVFILGYPNLVVFSFFDVIYFHVSKKIKKKENLRQPASHRHLLIFPCYEEGNLPFASAGSRRREGPRLFPLFILFFPLCLLLFLLLFG